MQYPIELHDFTKKFGQQKAVDKLSFNVKQGEVFGFLGPNGAGKTTTIRALLGITKPTSGTLTVLGQKPFSAPTTWRQNVGTLSGDMALYENLTGEQYLQLINHFHGGKHTSEYSALAAHLDAQLAKPIGSLSRGNKQKIGLIAALGHKPRLIILDEPTSGLDPVTQHTFAQLIRQRVNEGATVFLSSHVLSEVQELCDRVAFIRSGQLATVQDTQRLLADQPKRITLIFTHKIDVNNFVETNLLTEIQTKDKTVSGRAHASSNNIIKALATYDLQDLRIEVPDLEQIFMHYYEPEKEQAI